MSTSSNSSRFRTFGDTFGKGAPAFIHVADTGTSFTDADGNVISGAWRPATPTDFQSPAANVNVSGLNLGVGAVAITGTMPTQTVAITGNPTVVISGFNPIWVTGSFSTTVNSVGVTGNPGMVVTGFNTGITVAVSNLSELAQLSTANALLTGISGLLAGNLTDVASVKDVTGQLYLAAISGLLSSNLSSAAWVTGQVTDTITGWNTGIVITAQPNFSSSVSNHTPSGAVYPFSSSTPAFGQALASNPKRIFFFIQNISSGTPLYVRLGNSPASATGFSFILNPSLVGGYGGSSFGDDHYRGAVQASGAAWIAWEE